MHPSEIKIGQTELSVLSLFEMIDAGKMEFDKNPATIEFTEKSLFVESVLLGIAMLPIYADAYNPDKWFVLYGQKRLTTLHDFISGKFALKNLEYLSDYNQLNFKQLPQNIQRKLFQAKFTVYIISQGVLPEVRLSLMKRIIPEFKTIQSENILYSLFTQETRQLIYNLIDKPFLNFVINQKKEVNALEFVLKYLATFYSYFPDNRDKDFNTNSKPEDIIVYSNKYAIQNADMILHIWHKGIDRIEELFGDFAFKTNRKSYYINTYIYSSLIIYFGNFIGDREFNLLKLNRNSYLSAWFELYMDMKIKLVFKQTKLKKKIEILQELTEKTIEKNDTKPIHKEL